MRVFSHYAVDSLANSYIIGKIDGNDAIVIDPAVFDETMLEMIEHNGYFVRSILLTHSAENHLGGLRSILRIYDSPTIYAGVPRVLDMATTEVEDGMSIDICGMNVGVVALPGHGRDSVAYRVNGFLFTGIALTAGETGAVPNRYAKAILLADVQDRIFTLPDETVLFPFYGPPTTIGVERYSIAMENPTDPAE